MKILSIGSDRNLFKEGSDVRSRVIDYGKLTEELHIIVFSLNKLNLKEEKIADKVYIYPTNSRNRLSYIFDAIRIGKEIAKKTSNFDLVTCQDPFESGLVGWRLKKKLSLPLQLQIHTDLLSPHFIKESILNLIRVNIAKFLLPRADGIRVVSKRIKDSINSKFKIPNSKIEILSVFVDIEKVREISVSINLHEKYPERFIFLMASRITREKNIPLVIDAMEEIVKKHSKILLLIVGDGPEREALKEQVARNNLENNIVFEEAVSFEKLISHYKTSDTYILSSNYEGYGRTIIEALASSCPVISTDVGIAGEIENLTVIPVNGKKELVYAMLEHVKSPQIAPKLPKIGDYDEYLRLYKESWKKHL